MPTQMTAWEAAYQRFETPEREVRKFLRRLRKLRADRWDRDARVVELFCGRGSGLHALHRFGFRNVEGVDRSPALASRYQGAGRVYIADCRELPFADGCMAIAIVQGGLHHLPSVPDLDRTLAQVRRVLQKNGLFVAVEPWRTPFLRLVHCFCGLAWARRCSGKLDALAAMIEHERPTYERWLGQPQAVMEVLEKHFRPERCRIAWGKLMFVGRSV